MLPETTSDRFWEPEISFPGELQSVLLLTRDILFSECKYCLSNDVEGKENKSDYQTSPDG